MKNGNADSSSQPWLNRVLESLSDGLVLIDSENRVVFWNPRAAELVGWQSDEMVGRRADEMLERLAARTVDPEASVAKLREVIRSSQVRSSVNLELLPRPSGVDGGAPAGTGAVGAHYVSVCVFPVFDTLGSVSAVGILLSDVSREREADAMKSQLLSTVSHELRTPLASIKGFATTLLRQDVRWDDTTQRDFLKIIEEEADRLTEIIDNLLDMSQLEAGMLRITKAPTQLRTLIREVVDEMRMQTEAHWFVMDLPSGLPQVLADSRRIRQVLHNLVENAIKYSKGGQITVSCELRTDNIVVSVGDQGEGIPPESLNRVFDRFFQIDGASTRSVGGSGLGLSISRGIIQAHGGQIWAESTPGKGSTFRFTLPIVPIEGEE